MRPTDGFWVWIWNWRNCEGGDAAAVAARLHSVGARGAILKAADGAVWFDQGQPVSAIVAALRAQGTECATWQYCYGRDVAGEAQRAVETVQEAAPLFHVLDVEQEVEDLPDPAAAATALARSVLMHLPAGYPLCYSPLPAIRYHLKLPYRQLTDAGLTMLPQLYWTGLGWTPQQTAAVFYADAAQYDLLPQPVAPAYEDAPGARASDADLDAFVQLTLAQGATGLSVWSYEHLDAAGWQRAARAAQAIAAKAASIADPCAGLGVQLAALTQQRDALQHTLDAVRAALAG
jgi:hypothetical protein